MLTNIILVILIVFDLFVAIVAVAQYRMSSSCPYLWFAAFAMVMPFILLILRGMKYI